MSTSTAIENFWNYVSTGSLGRLAMVATLVAADTLVQAQKRKRLPPGPRPWPVVGNLFVMFSAKPHLALKKRACKYGGIMYLRLGSKACIIISTAAALKEVFRPPNDVRFSNRPTGLFAQVFSDTDNRFFGAAPYGPYWQQLRKFSSSKLLSATTLASYRGVREEEVRNMITILAEKSGKGKAINVKLWLFELSANVMTMMIVKKRYFGRGGRSQEEKKELLHAFASYIKGFQEPPISDFLPMLTILTKLRGQDRQFKNIRDDAIRIVARMTELEKRRERAKERALRDNDKHYVPDLVDLITAEPLDNGKPLPDNVIMLMLLELLVAGTTTQANNVEWAMAQLMANPDVMKRARKELDAVVGCDRVMQESHLPNLPYLQAIVKETFRVHQTTMIRASSQSAEAWGYKIPAGSQIFINVHAINRDPAVYQNPEVFNPQRFVDRLEANHMSRYEFHELIPFGLGRRMCPGVSLGNTMVHVMLGNLIHSFDWSFPKGQSVETCQMDNLEDIFGLTICRNKPLILLAKPRQSPTKHRSY